MKVQKGFALSIEAAFSLLLLALATSTIHFFHFASQEASDYYLCTDAAILLSGASEEGLDDYAQKLSSESGLCISAKLNSRNAPSGCIGKGKEAFAFSIPFWSKERVERLEIHCSKR
ncbi:MAG: hypothetical protein QW275_00065 [Candidatus Anstonellaceae archaeon]